MTKQRPGRNCGPGAVLYRGFFFLSFFFTPPRLWRAGHLVCLSICLKSPSSPAPPLAGREMKGKRIRLRIRTARSAAPDPFTVTDKVKVKVSVPFCSVFPFPLLSRFKIVCGFFRANKGKAVLFCPLTPRKPFSGRRRGERRGSARSCFCKAPDFSGCSWAGPPAQSPG